MLRPLKEASSGGLLRGREFYPATLGGSTDMSHDGQGQAGARREQDEREMGRGTARSHIYSQEKVNRRPPTISSNDDSLCMQHAVVKSSSCRGSVRKRSHPRPINHHASSRPQAVMARRAPHLPFGFAWKPSPSAPWAWGLLSVSWTWGYPVLPACGPPRGSINGLVRSSFNTNSTRPSRG